MVSLLIDKLALIYLQNRHLLVTLSKGKDVWYIPGGKREGSETDIAALSREIYEELAVRLQPDSIQYYGTFEAQAHGQSEGIIVRMTCYQANLIGNPIPTSEIEKLAYFSYIDKLRCSPVDHLIFDDLKAKNLID